MVFCFHSVLLSLMINTSLLPHFKGFPCRRRDTNEPQRTQIFSSVKGLSNFSGVIKNRKKTKSCAQAETDDHVLNEIACANAFSELGPVLCYLLQGWGARENELEALFSLEMRESSEVLKPSGCLQGPLFPVCSCRLSTVLLLSLPVPLVRVFITPVLAATLSPLKGTVLIYFDKESFLWFVLHRVLKPLKISYLDLIRKQISCCMRKRQDSNVFVVKEAEKGKFISFHWNDIIGRFSHLWCFSLSSFLFFNSPLHDENITLNNTIKFSVRNNFNFGYMGYTGIVDVLLMVKHMQVMKNISVCWESAVSRQEVGGERKKNKQAHK